MFIQFGQLPLVVYHKFNPSFHSGLNQGRSQDFGLEGAKVMAPRVTNRVVHTRQGRSQDFWKWDRELSEVRKAH